MQGLEDEMRSTAAEVLGCQELSYLCVKQWQERKSDPAGAVHP